MLSAALSLVGAIIYGSADFFGGLAARRLRSIVVTALSAFAGLLALAVALPIVGGVWRFEDALWGVLAGGFGMVAIVLLYASLAIGPMSILSPLTAVLSAVAPVLWGLTVNGETLSTVGYTGLAVALVAVVLVGFVPGAKVVRPQLRAIVMGAGAGLAIGAFLIVMDRTHDDSGLVPLFVSRVTSTAVTTIVVGALILTAVRRGGRASAVLDASGPPLGATASGRADLDHVGVARLPLQMTRQRAVGFAARVRCTRRLRQRRHARRAAPGRPVDRVGAHSALSRGHDPARRPCAPRARRPRAMARARSRARRGRDARAGLTAISARTA